ncbi:MAG: hypothetical protein KDA22_08000 [Phycisphaerales bacterium]|nr:hypothetical protein [Phycisphaerales bacterium]
MNAASYTSSPSSGAVVRTRLIECLHRALESEGWALAAWLGGSDANGRTDQWSDIDLVAIVEDGKVEDAFAVCERAVSTVAPIAERIRFPMPTWHGHDQALWQLEGVPDWCMIDLVIMNRSSEAGRFLEPERHGHALVLFDRAGLARPEPLDRAAHAARVRERLEAIGPRFRMTQHLVRKAVWRGDALEAGDRYLAFTLRPLVELLRIKHCPDRFDFGLRYLRDDLPTDAWREIEPLALPGELEAVLTAQSRAEAIFERELATIGGSAG